MIKIVTDDKILSFCRKNALFLAIFLAIAIKSIWIYSNYNISNDISVQMNIAQNVYDGHGIKGTRIEKDTLAYRPELTYGTAIPVLLAALNFFTNNIVKADLVLRLLLVLSESILLVLVVFKYFDRNKDRFLITLTLCLYIGHLDRGKTGDYLSMVIVLAIVYLIIHRDSQSINFQPKVLLISLLTLALPFVKYSAAPVILLPLSTWLVNYYASGRKLFNYSELKVLALSSIISVCSLFSLAESNGSFSLRLEKLWLLARIDYFWLHLGHNGDRIWKHFSWNISEHFGYQIPYYNIAQIGTLAIVIFIAFLMRSKLSTIKLELIVVITLLVLQVGFLGYLTLSSEPQSGDWGVDQKIWVFIEEARYYNYLTFLLMAIMCFLTYKFYKPVFYVLLIFILIGSVRGLDFWNSRFPHINQKYETRKSGLQTTDKNSNQITKEDVNVGKIFQW